MGIENWLKDFNTFWKAKQIDSVLDLFTDDVEYWETPFKKLHSKEEITAEWQSIMAQENLVVSTALFASENNKYTVIWGIAYNKNSEDYAWAGTYLIELNESGRCSYFLQTGEQK
jgi:hypothetical protein